ncbi:MAG TPA: hypothetical protein VFY77_01870, partial [Nitrososphaeraceae archaeon]|nr:hypothetical protein [Nitrososphaeraceae archaeon]
SGVHSNMLYEWVNPLTFQGSGAYPFRTGISSVRIAAIESLTHRASEYNDYQTIENHLGCANTNTNK